MDQFRDKNSKMLGQILVYTMSGCPHCTSIKEQRVKSTLNTSHWFCARFQEGQNRVQNTSGVHNKGPPQIFEILKIFEKFFDF